MKKSRSKQNTKLAVKKATPKKKPVIAADAWDDDATEDLVERLATASNGQRAKILAKAVKDNSIQGKPTKPKRTVKSVDDDIFGAQPAPKGKAPKRAQLQPISSLEDIKRFTAKPPIKKSPHDDIFGQHPKLKVALAPGVFLSKHRCSALVFDVSGGQVQALCLGGTAGIELIACSVEKFLVDFPVSMPNYPMRRAADIYIRSPLPKSDEALRQLRAMYKR